MCGIAGHATPRGSHPDSEAVRRATADLAHRGPDGSGVITAGEACLGHRRLSIIDLEHSPQPRVDEEGRYHLVFNGEIYNFRELREELGKLGHRFRSQGDTEVLLELYRRYGADCLKRLNGMFAFAVWDARERLLFLARDRAGKKPLYYARVGSGLVFASEIAALHHFRGIDMAVDEAAINDYFAYQYIPGETTIHRGIRKLPPAHSLTFRDGQLEQRRYWRLPLPCATAPSEAAAARQLRDLIQDAVRLRLRSDVPVGVFLSGGIDSAVIAAALHRLGADLESFTVGFGSGSFDESQAARETAEFFATRHHLQALKLELPGLVEQSARQFGEPFADPSAIPTWQLCRFARERVTVALSGDGGDELFGGYRRYYAAGLIARYRRIPTALRRPLARILLRRLPEGEGYYGHSLTKKLKLFLHLAERLDESPEDHLPQTFSLSERRALLSDGLAHPGHHPEEHTESLELRQAMMIADFESYLAEDILTKVDRMSMAHGLEVRSPLLDYRILEFAARLPLALKLSGSRQKHLLRQAFADQLPAAVVERPKHGFAVPLGGALRRELAPLFRERVLDAPCPEALRRVEIERLWHDHQAGRIDHGFKLWTILNYFLWQQTRRT